MRLLAMSAGPAEEPAKKKACTASPARINTKRPAGEPVCHLTLGTVRIEAPSLLSFSSVLRCNSS